jgi:hypothetical protein
MSLCDELYGKAEGQLKEMYGRFDGVMLDRRVMHLLCELVEKLIIDADQHRRDHRAGLV